MAFGEVFANWASGGKPPAQKQNTDGFNTDGNRQQNNNDGNNPPNKTFNNNVSDDDTKLLDDVWKAQAKKEEPPPNNQQQPPNNQQQPAPVDPAQRLQTHLKEMGLDPIVLSEQDIEGFKTGENVQSIMDRINAKVQASYLKSMQNVSTLIDDKVKNALSEANRNTGALLEGVELKKFLEGGIPYIKDSPILGPVAETAFKTFYERTDKNKDRALKLTKQFLEKSAETVNANNPDMQRVRESFRGSPASDRDGDGSWLDVLTGK